MDDAGSQAKGETRKMLPQNLKKNLSRPRFLQVLDDKLYKRLQHRKTMSIAEQITIQEQPERNHREKIEERHHIERSMLQRGNKALCNYKHSEDLDNILGKRQKGTKMQDLQDETIQTRSQFHFPK